MPTKADGKNEDRFAVKRYKVQYPVSAYTFPKEACIQQVRFSKEHLQVDLADGRMLSVPLKWIPTLYSARAEDREQYEINQSRTTIIWDPDKCGINDELRIAEYLGPCGDKP